MDEIYTEMKADNGWAGYYEPADGSWIRFVADDGTEITFDERDETGAVV